MGLDKIFGDKVITTTVDFMKRWARKNALWPMPFGTACCAIEMMATLSGRYDLSRFGAEVIRFSPRQSDLMIVSGRISIKMMPVLITIYEQMPDPKWVISMGACASSGGVFDTYTLVQGVDQFLPVHVYIPGCPPRPESLIDALLKIQEIIDRSPETVPSPLGPPEGTVASVHSRTVASGPGATGKAAAGEGGRTA